MKKIKVNLMGAVAALSLVGTGASASYAAVLPLPSATVLVTNSQILPNDERIQTVSSGSINLSLPSAGVTAEGKSAFGPLATLTGSTTSTFGNQGTVHGQLQYFFSVIGPSNVSVPILISSSGSVTTPSVSDNAIQLYLKIGRAHV